MKDGGSDKSDLKTRSLGYSNVPSLATVCTSWKIVMGHRFKVSPEILEKPGIGPTTPGKRIALPLHQEVSEIKDVDTNFMSFDSA